MTVPTVAATFRDMNTATNPVETPAPKSFVVTAWRLFDGEQIRMSRKHNVCVASVRGDGSWTVYNLRTNRAKRGQAATVEAGQAAADVVLRAMYANG